MLAGKFDRPSELDPKGKKAKAGLPGKKRTFAPVTGGGEREAMAAMASRIVSAAGP